MKSLEPGIRPRHTRPLTWTALAVLGFAVGAPLAACSSSSKGTTIGAGDVKGTGGAGDGSAPRGSGGDSLFADGGGFLTDAGTRVIQPDAACGNSTIVATPKQVNILLVIDESGSMTDTPGDSGPDKWTTLKTALGSALTAVKNDIAFGLELFPYPVDPKKPIPASCQTNCCQMPTTPGLTIPIGPGATSVPKILSALDAASPGGGTPTALALTRALDYFKTGAGSTLTGDRYVLLATDGGPDCNAGLTCTATTCTTNLDGACSLPSGGNCCDAQFGGADAKARCLDDTATNDAIKALSAAGVKTFVIGIPGTEAYKSYLDTFAVSGGEISPLAPPSYYAVSAAGGTTELTSVLGSITQNLVTSCILPLTSAPQNNDLLNVLVDGKLVPKGPDGWHLDTSTTPPTVILDGATCTTVKAEGAQRVQILYGCLKLTR